MDNTWSGTIGVTPTMTLSRTWFPPHSLCLVDGTLLLPKRGSSGVRRSLSRLRRHLWRLPLFLLGRWLTYECSLLSTYGLYRSSIFSRLNKCLTYTPHYVFFQDLRRVIGLFILHHSFYAFKRFYVHSFHSLSVCVYEILPLPSL